MKCKQIREVIDTASRHTLYNDSVKTHLSGCHDCRRHADGTASLLTLLSAQPRVEAPADFDIKVSMGIARAQAEMLNDKTASLLTLLKAQPRVEAPADFDFRLSAGIARAQAEQLRQTSVFERAWEKLARTISLGQATAMAAAALVVVTASTYYINLNNPSPAPTSDIAKTMPAGSTLAEMKPAPAIQTPAVSEVNAARMIAAKSAGQSLRGKTAMFRPDGSPSENNLTYRLPSPGTVYSPDLKKVVSPDPAFGADSVLAKAATSGPSL